MKMIKLIVLALLFAFNATTIFAEDGIMKNKDTITLPQPDLTGNMSLEEAIQKRRSVRSFLSKALTPEQISQLLWSAQGITDKRGLRAAPSAGALYPLEIYLAKDDGLFHYVPGAHALEAIGKDDIREELARAALGQRFIAQAPISIVIAALGSRVTGRYGLRGERYVDIEVGHAAQNVHLQAVALGLVSVPVGAFKDEAVNGLFGLPDDTEAVYIIPVGYAK